jgi:putative nucleotidyltransferase with HDIG domain
MNNKQQILNKLFSGTRQLPTLPILFTEINRMLDNPFTSNRKISHLLMKDQSMVAKILKLSNSALYAKRQEITNLTNAITFLGTQTLRNLILQIALVRLFPFDDKEIPEFSANTFWEHSLGTAYFTNTLVKKLNLPSSDDYYLGGLLHDLGKLVVYQFYPQKFKDITLKQLKEDAVDIEAEQEVLGVNHADIGEFLAEKWKFKPNIVAAIRDHHKTLRSPAVHVAVVRISNLFSKAAALCFPWDKRVFDIVGDPAWEILKNHAKGEVDVERMTFEIQDESDKIKESVNELLSKKA